MTDQGSSSDNNAPLFWEERWFHSEAGLSISQRSYIGSGDLPESVFTGHVNITVNVGNEMGADLDGHFHIPASNISEAFEQFPAAMKANYKRMREESKAEVMEQIQQAQKIHHAQREKLKEIFVPGTEERN